MAELPTKYPVVARKFRAGSFTIQKMKKVFFTIAIDQAHEQDNACIKRVGGAVGLTDNPGALLRCQTRSCQGHRRVPRWGRALWKQQMASLKNDLQLFSWLYIGCQMRGGNLQEFFHHENQTTSVVIVQMLTPAAVKNLEEYAQETFIPYLPTKLQTASRLDLVWDSCTVDSLKSSARTKH